MLDRICTLPSRGGIGFQTLFAQMKSVSSSPRAATVYFPKLLISFFFFLPRLKCCQSAQRGLRHSTDSPGMPRDGFPGEIPPRATKKNHPFTIQKRQRFVASFLFYCQLKNVQSLGIILGGSFKTPEPVQHLKIFRRLYKTRKKIRQTNKYLNPTA